MSEIKRYSVYRKDLLDHDWSDKYGMMKHVILVADHDTEVERLVIERDHFKGAFNNTVETLQRNLAELAKWKKHAEEMQKVAKCWKAKSDRVEGEIERLRAELDSETKLHLENEAKHMALVIGLKDQIDALREALGKITEIEFAGSCCGCGKDDGFDEVQKLASAALATGERK